MAAQLSVRPLDRRRLQLSDEILSSRMATTHDIEVFISHSNADRELARATFDVLNASLRLDQTRVRCTSLDGSRLPAGVSTDERLRDEVLTATVFIGILSPSSLTSTYVLFELGARWAVQRRIFPMLAGGVEVAQLRPLLSNLNVLSMHELAELHQFIREVGEELNIQPQPPDFYHRHMTELIRLAATKPPQEQSIATNEAGFVQQLKIDPPRVVIADGMREVERAGRFTGAIQAIEVSEATTVRVRYDWEVHIVNSAEARRGFYGHVSFLDANRYEVARHDISILRPYRAPGTGEETYHSFLYVSPQH